jgi:F-type H+-transporting ATPase subunit a
MSFLAADFTLFNLIPGWTGLDHSIAAMFGSTVLEGQPVPTVVHLALMALVVTIVLAMTVRTRSSWATAGGDAYIPAPGFNARNVLEMLMDTVLSMSEQVLGSKHEARRFFPLIGTLTLFILFSNLIGLIPGMLPPTEFLSVTLAPAVVVFLTTHIMGLKANGMHYLAHFLGPKLGGFPWLAPIMLPIELISHFARPLSLSLRLFGNMVGDHQVLAVFLGLVAFPILFPLPIMVLGTIVCVVQTMVFGLLTVVYIGLAIEHSEEAH